MCEFIGLNQESRTVYINLSRVDAFTRSNDLYKGETAIFVGGSSIPFYVKESVEEIKDLINQR